MKNIIVFLNFIIINFYFVKNSCIRHRLKDGCLDSPGCCWHELQFKGEDFKLCINNYAEEDKNDMTKAFNERPEFTFVDSNCSLEVNTCYQKNENDCLSSENDCCLLRSRISFPGMEPGTYPEELTQCLPNDYGTAKGFNTLFKNSFSSIGGPTLLSVSTRCKEEDSSFYSTCFEQVDEKSCLTSDSNCCWMSYSAKMKDNDVEAKGYYCGFNFFRNATMMKQYANVMSQYANSAQSSVTINYYDVKCNKHDHALFGEPETIFRNYSKEITYDSDFSGKGTTTLYEEANSGFKYSINFALFLFVISIVLV